MDYSKDADLLPENSHPHEESHHVGDSYISPYNSPDKTLNSHYPNESGDHNTSMKFGAENQQFLANQITEKNVEVLSLNPKPDYNFEINSGERKVLGDQKNNFSEDLLHGIQYNEGIVAEIQIEKDNINGLENKELTIPQDHTGKIDSNMELQPEENKMQTEESTEVRKVTEVKGEQALAELIASTTEMTPNNDMTPSEMATISKKMEEEFRSMLVMEQKRKKQLIEGSSHYEVATTETHRTTRTPNNSNKKQQKNLPRPKTYSSNSKSSQNLRTPPAKQTPNSVKKTTERLATPTKTTFRVANKTPNLELKSTKSPRSALADRKPGSPTSGRDWKLSSKFTPTKPLSALTTTPVRSRKPISTSQTPNSAPVGRSPLVSPRSTSDQSLSAKKITHKMPDTKNVQSKIGSMQNAKHTPGGGKVKIENKKTDYSQVSSKIGSKANLTHTPQGGKVKIENRRLEFNNVQSRCGSMSNINHTPGGGKVKIEHKKVDVSKVSSKCGSRDNITHTPGGGKTKVETKKLDFSHVSSKCGSKDNLKHTAQGGNVKIYNEKVDLSGVKSKVGSTDNIKHTPSGGKVQIVNKSLDFSQVKSKCGSLDNAAHLPGGGNLQIFDEKQQFNQTAKSKIGSLENARHVPGGGDVQIFDEKLRFSETAAPRISADLSSSSMSSM